MRFKGLPFHFSLRLKYKEEREGGREGGKLRQQIVSKDSGEVGGERRAERREFEALTVNLNFGD